MFGPHLQNASQLPHLLDVLEDLPRGSRVLVYADAAEKGGPHPEAQLEGVKTVFLLAGLECSIVTTRLDFMQELAEDYAAWVQLAPLSPSDAQAFTLEQQAHLARRMGAPVNAFDAPDAPTPSDAALLAIQLPEGQGKRRGIEKVIPLLERSIAYGRGAVVQYWDLARRLKEQGLANEIATAGVTVYAPLSLFGPADPQVIKAELEKKHSGEGLRQVQQRMMKADDDRRAKDEADAAAAAAAEQRRIQAIAAAQEQQRLRKIKDEAEAAEQEQQRLAAEQKQAQLKLQQEVAAAAAAADPRKRKREEADNAAATEKKRRKDELEAIKQEQLLKIKVALGRYSSDVTNQVAVNKRPMRRAGATNCNRGLEDAGGSDRQVGRW